MLRLLQNKNTNLICILCITAVYLFLALPSPEAVKQGCFLLLSVRSWFHFLTPLFLP